MKSPRELLLNKHRTVSPKLDVIRREVVAQLPRASARRVGDGWLAGCDLLAWLLARLWTELFVPCRRIWLGLAAIWCLVIALNLSSRETTVQTAKGPAPRAEEVIASLRENQQRIMAELGVASLQPEIAGPREPGPVVRPRSERIQPVAMA